MIERTLIHVAGRRAPVAEKNAELLAAARARREERKRRAAEEKAGERARREREAAIAYEKRLDALALREDAAWHEVDTLIEVRKPPSTTRPCSCSRISGLSASGPEPSTPSIGACGISGSGT